MEEFNRDRAFNSCTCAKTNWVTLRDCNTAKQSSQASQLKAVVMSKKDAQQDSIKHTTIK